MCQPLDVGINKPFKARVRRQWEEWMTDLIDATNEVRDATREEVVEWATAAYWEMAITKKGILRNAWRKTAYDWFPDGLANGGDEGDDDNDGGGVQNVSGDEDGDDDDEDEDGSGNNVGGVDGVGDRGDEDDNKNNDEDNDDSDNTAI